MNEGIVCFVGMDTFSNQMKDSCLDLVITKIEGCASSI